MPNKSKGKNTGAKLRVLDELGIHKKDGGLYAILLYSNVDAGHKTVWKCGLATGFWQRIDSYHTTGQGVYVDALLANIPYRRSRGSAKTKRSHWLRAEAFLFDSLVKLGARRVSSTTHIRKPTEQFYCTQQVIHDAFEKTRLQYGGVLHLFDINAYDPVTKQEDSTITQSQYFEKHISPVLYHLQHECFALRKRNLHVNL